MKLFRIRNRILQLFYRPRPAGNPFFPSGTLSAFDAIEKAIEEKITPLLSGLFD
jgi:hypothetical protein